MQNKALKNTRFFIQNEVIEWLTQNYSSQADQVSLELGDEFIYDVIEQPFQCHIKAEATQLSAKLFVRNETGVFDEDLGIVIYTNGAQPKLTQSGRIGGDAAATILNALNVGVWLKHYLEETNQVAWCQALDPANEGVFVEIKNRKLKCTRVAGDARPEIACMTMFRGVQMIRPYDNTIM